MTIANILKQTKSPNHLKTSPNGKVATRTDLPPLDIVFVESPLILVPSHSLRLLIKNGRACAFCGDVIKAYDGGLIKDQKNKNMDALKHQRFINGLDCDQCLYKWCSLQCKQFDEATHWVLNHRPINKSNTNSFGHEVLNWAPWSKLEKLLCDPIKYGVFKCIMACVINDKIKEMYLELPHADEKFPMDDQWLEFHDFLNKSFKNFELSLDELNDYIRIYQRNNYEGSIYLIFSQLTQDLDDRKVNCKMEMFTNNQYTSFDEIDVNTHLVKHITTHPNQKPIYPIRNTQLNKKLLQCKSTVHLTLGEEIVIPKDDYSQPRAIEEDELIYLNEGGIPKIIIPHDSEENNNNSKKNSHRARANSIHGNFSTANRRRASLTSSGASFGEGIIKYNREQIREMLKGTLEETDIDTDCSIDELDTEGDDDDEVFKKMKDLSIGLGRRKSVRFADGESVEIEITPKTA